MENDILNRNEDDEFDEAHYDRAKIRKILLELGMRNPFYTLNEELNENISIKEIQKWFNRQNHGRHVAKI